MGCHCLLQAFALKVKVAQSCPTLCDPMDYTVHGILQARILEWVAFPFSRGSSQPRDQTQVSCTAGILATHFSILAWKIPWIEEPCRLQSMGLQRVGHNRATSLLLYQLSHKGSPRIVEWVAYPFSSGSSDPGIELGSRALQVDSLPTEF